MFDFVSLVKWVILDFFFVNIIEVIFRIKEGGVYVKFIYFGDIFVLEI